MKNKIFNVFTILAIIISVCVVVYGAIEIKKLKDPNSVESFIAVYENEPSNRHLIALCNKLSIEKDKRFFKYLDKYMNMENYNGEIKSFENGNITDEQIDLYHDFMITSAFKICVKNNDIDLFTETLLKYYPQIRDKDKLFYLSLANDDTAESTEFFKANIERILNAFEELYAKADTPKLKFRCLMEISTYYHCEEVKNYELCKEKHGDEMAQLIKECGFDSDMKNVAVVSAYFKSYWEHLLTGEDNEVWNSALNETMTKYNKSGNRP